MPTPTPALNNDASISHEEEAKKPKSSKTKNLFIAIFFIVFALVMILNRRTVLYFFKGNDPVITSASTDSLAGIRNRLVQLEKDINVFKDSTDDIITDLQSENLALQDSIEELNKKIFVLHDTQKKSAGKVAQKKQRKSTEEDTKEEQKDEGISLIPQ